MELVWRLVIYALILIVLYIFIKLSKLQINGIKLVKLKYRVLIALLFPIIILILLIFGSIVITTILLVAIIIILIYLLKRLTKSI